MAYINGNGLVEYLPSSSEAYPVLAEQKPELGDLRTGQILSAVGYEASALVFAALPHVGIFADQPLTLDELPPSFRFESTQDGWENPSTRTQIDSFMSLVQGSNPLVNLCDDYFSSKVKNLAARHEDLIVRYDDERSVDVYQLTEAGFWLALPLAGWLLKWGYDFNVPLRHALGSTKQGKVKADTQDPEAVDISVADSTLTRFGVLASLSDAGKKGVKVREIVDQSELPIGGSAVGNHLERLCENGIVTKVSTLRQKGFSDVTYILAPAIKEAIDALLLIYVRMNQYDKAFYLDGHQLADGMISNPGTVGFLMRRVELTDVRMAAASESLKPVVLFPKNVFSITKP